MSSYKRPGSSSNVLERVRDVERRITKKEIVFPHDPDDRPGRVTGAAGGLNYFIREKKTDLWFNGVVSIDALPPGACAGDIELYECQLRPMEKNNQDVWVPVDHYKVQKEFFFVDNPDDLPEVIRFQFGYLEHPKEWSWQWRARALLKGSRTVGLWGPNAGDGWSDRYGPPWYDANPKPPFPQDIFLTVYKNTKDRHEPRWECRIESEEVGPWDIPPVDGNKEKKQKEDDVDEYEFLLRFVDAQDNWITYQQNGRTKYRQRRVVVKAKDQDDNAFVSAIVHNLRKSDRFKVKGRTFDRFKRPGEWSPFTATASGIAADDQVPKVRHPISGAVGDFIADLDQHDLTLRYDYPEDPDDTDPDLKDPDPDIVGVQIQVSDRADFNKGLSNIWEEDKQHSAMKWKVNIKKPSGTLHIRIRCRNSSGAKSGWATKQVNTKIPPVPDNLVSVNAGKMKKNKHGKWYAQGEFEYNEAGYNEDHIGTWYLLIQVNSTLAGHTAANGWGNDPEDRHTFHEKDKRSNGKFRHRFKKLAAKDYVSMAYGVKDKQGRASPLSDWSAPVRLSTNQGPQKPTNVTRKTSHRRVGIVGKKPMDPDDASIPDTNIIEFRVQRATNSTFTNIVDDDYTDTPKKMYDLAKGDSNQYFLRMASVDEEGNQSNWVHDNGTESPPPSGAVADTTIDLGTEVSGNVSYGQMGTLGISRYGTSAPTPAKNGDIWIDTNFSPPRVKRYENGVWNAAIDGSILVAGTVLADAVVAGALDGYTINGAFINGGFITGSVVRTSSNQLVSRVEMGNLNELDRVSWFGNTGGLRGEISASSGHFVIESFNGGDLKLKPTGGRVHFDVAVVPNSSPGDSGLFLNCRVNGTDYKIKLFQN